MICSAPFALPGDSGSLVFGETGPHGILHAVRVDADKSYACKASNIERLLGVSFVPPSLDWLPAEPRDASRLPRETTARFEILVGGISIGHRNATAGTLGCFVWDSVTGDVLGLTCAHIAAPPGAVRGDPIYQPGPLDIRAQFHREPSEEDIAGYLERWIPLSVIEPNLVDAAVFRPVRPVWPEYMLFYGSRRLLPPAL